VGRGGTQGLARRGAEEEVTGETAGVGRGGWRGGAAGEGRGGAEGAGRGGAEAAGKGGLRGR